MLFLVLFLLRVGEPFVPEFAQFGVRLIFKVNCLFAEFVAFVFIVFKCEAMFARAGEWEKYYGT